MSSELVLCPRLGGEDGSARARTSIRKRSAATVSSARSGISTEYSFTASVDVLASLDHPVSRRGAHVAYVGSAGRHLVHSRNLNATPYGANFLPSSADATSPGRPLPVNFLRPYRGYGDISYRELAGTSNFHSLQTQVNPIERGGIRNLEACIRCR